MVNYDRSQKFHKHRREFYFMLRQLPERNSLTYVTNAQRTVNQHKRDLLCHDLHNDEPELNAALLLQIMCIGTRLVGYHRKLIDKSSSGRSIEKRLNPMILESTEQNQISISSKLSPGAIAVTNSHPHGYIESGHNISGKTMSH